MTTKANLVVKLSVNNGVLHEMTTTLFVRFYSNRNMSFAEMAARIQIKYAQFRRSTLFQINDGEPITAEDYLKGVIANEISEFAVDVWVNNQMSVHVEEINEIHDREVWMTLRKNVYSEGTIEVRAD